MKKTDDKAISLISKKHFYTHKAELRIGDWSKHFDLNYVNTIIAMALNQCVKEKEFIINGYLITTQSLFLIIKTDKKAIDDIVNKMEHHTSHLLPIHSHKLKKNKHKTDFIIDDENIYYVINAPLFKLYPFKNDYLIQLITGKKVELPYFDRELEELKLMIQHHPFCSVIDYSGAIGPVDVELLADQT